MLGRQRAGLAPLLLTWSMHPEGKGKIRATCHMFGVKSQESPHPLFQVI